jgi:hypothetical protein
MTACMGLTVRETRIAVKDNQRACRVYDPIGSVIVYLAKRCTWAGEHSWLWLDAMTGGYFRGSFIFDRIIAMTAIGCYHAPFP